MAEKNFIRSNDIKLFFPEHFTDVISFQNITQTLQNLTRGKLLVNTGLKNSRPVAILLMHKKDKKNSHKP